jgi:glutathione synthase/RimK-type ligase-like ATP-grasp enzyme
MGPRVLFLKGVDDTSSAKVLIDARGQVQLALSGGVNVDTFLVGRGIEGAALLLAPVDRRPSLHLERPALLFNEISDADTHREALKRARQVREIFADLACLNEPSRVETSTRDRVAELLAGIDGVILPSTRRFRPTSPDDVAELWRQTGERVLLRRAGQHGGVGTVLLERPEDLTKLYAVALDGSDYYMTEFVDYRSADGYFRKLRVAVVDGEPFVRHQIAGAGWNVHMASRTYGADDPLGREEASLLDRFEREWKPLIAERVRTIAERLGLDFFGIDCHVTADGDLLLFEANATMNLLVNPAAGPNMWQRCIDRMLDALVLMIRARMRES